MENQPEVIRKDMEETRTALTEKLEALEGKMADTVKETTEAVSETVENVKETVSDVTEAVKETATNVVQTLSLSYQAERRPWMVFGGSVGAGFLLGWLTGGREEPSVTPASAVPTRSHGRGNGSAHGARSASTRQTASSTGGGGMSWFSEQLNNLKGLAVGSLMGVIRDLAKRNLPENVGSRVAEEVDNLTRNMGGEPISGSILPGAKQEAGGQEQRSEEPSLAGSQPETATAGTSRINRTNPPHRRN